MEKRKSKARRKLPTIGVAVRKYKNNEKGFRRLIKRANQAKIRRIEVESSTGKNPKTCVSVIMNRRGGRNG